MVSGNWIPEMVAIAGGSAILADPGKHSSYMEWQQIVASDPDIIVVMPCGFSYRKNAERDGYFAAAVRIFGFKSSKKHDRLYLADGNQYFNRPGPRIVDSIEILAEIIHPKQFIFGYEGEGWIRFAL